MHAHRPIALFAALILAVLLAGCAQRSVRHLDRAPLAAGKNESLGLRFWRFEYSVREQSGSYHLSGRAHPVKESLPEWADWIDELAVSVYVSDASGSVLVEEQRNHLPGPLNPDTGVPLDFTLDGDDLGEGTLFLTFGYRMALGKGKPKAGAPDPGRPLFFANERAVEVF